MTAKDDRGWNLYQRGGQWVISFRVAPGKWRETRVPREHRTERAAERYALAWLQAYRKELGERPAVAESEDPRGPTIRDLAQRWFELSERNPKLSPATRHQHVTCMTVHVLGYREVADVPIADLGPATLRAWLRKVRDDGKVTQRWETRDGQRVRTLVRGGPLAPFSCRNVVNSLTAFFADALAEEWIDLPANPMKHEAVRREVPEGVTLAGKHTIVHFSRPVAERLLTCPGVPEWRRVRVLVALTSGMAEGELAGLRFDDLDLDADVPIVRVTKALAQKGAGGWATLGRTKTENRVRTLPLHSLAVRSLKAWRATGWAKWVGHHPRPTDFLFPNEKGEGWRPDMAPMLRADLRAAGLPDQYEGNPFTAHATRRSFATWLTEAGVAESTIKRLMGHAGSGVTQQHYTAQTLATLKAAVETIRLDLSTGEVIALPMRAVGGSERDPQADGHTAEFTAGLPQAAVNGGVRKRRNPNDSEGSGTRVSNSRPSAWEADALPTELVPQQERALVAPARHTCQRRKKRRPGWRFLVHPGRSGPIAERAFVHRREPLPCRLATCDRLSCGHSARRDFQSELASRAAGQRPSGQSLRAPSLREKAYGGRTRHGNRLTTPAAPSDLSHSYFA